MRYAISCRLHYAIPGPSAFVFNVAPPDTPFQRVERESLSVKPEHAVEEFADPEGLNRFHRLEAAGGELTLAYEATVVSEPTVAPAKDIRANPPAALPPATFPYVVPSRHCESDLLMRLSWRSFGKLPETIARPAQIADWINENVDYLAGSSGSMTSAFNTVTSRAGVCRDFAHLGIAFCRAINIPARFVSCYAFDLMPRDFHAVFEAWLDGRWYLFDPTGRASPGGLVRLGTGRDAADVSFALIFGPAILRWMDVRAEACDAESETLPKSWVARAISTA